MSSVFLTSRSAHASKAVSKCELHKSWLRQRAVIGSEHGGGLFQLSRILWQGRHVESNCVGNVEYLPAELQALRFGDRPQLAEAAVDSEVARPAQLVTLSRLARQRIAKVALRRDWVLEQTGIAILIEESAGLRPGSGQNCG